MLPIWPAHRHSQSAPLDWDQRVRAVQPPGSLDPEQRGGRVDSQPFPAGGRSKQKSRYEPGEMEPSTPPRAHRIRDVPATPATPRFGTFEDLPEAKRRPQPARSTSTPHRRKRGAAELATPRQTPHKRKVVSTPRQRVLFPDEPQLPHVDEDAEEEPPAAAAKAVQNELDLEDDEPEVSEDEAAALEEESEDEPEPLAPVHAGASRPVASRPHQAEPAAPYTEWGHPHQDRPPPNVPGMWYVFRGKKVFRPLPAGAKPVEPVTLFKNEIAAQQQGRQHVSESEEDTDVESLW